MIYLDLFIGFLEVGLFSFGGAYAAIPLIRDVVLAYGWIDEQTLTYMIAVSESTPGPIMINLATYVGSEKGGILGAVIATFAVVLPAFIIIILLVRILASALKNSYVKAVLDTLKPCIIGIIMATGAFMVIENVFTLSNLTFDLKSALITLGLAVVYYGSRKMTKKGMSPLLLIGFSAIIGIIAYI